MFHKPSDIRLHVAERSRDMPALLRYPIQPSNHLGYVIGPIGEMAAPSWFSSSSNQLEEITAGGMKLDSQGFATGPGDGDIFREQFRI